MPALLMVERLVSLALAIVVFMLGSHPLVPGVDVLEVCVELNQDPVARRCPVGDVGGLRQCRVPSWHSCKSNGPIRRLSCGHPDVHTCLEGRLEIRYRFEGRNLILGSVESE